MSEKPETNARSFSPLGVHDLYILSNLTDPENPPDENKYGPPPYYYVLTRTQIGGATLVDPAVDPKDPNDPARKEWLQELKEDGAMLALRPPIVSTEALREKLHIEPTEEPGAKAVLCMMINYDAIDGDYTKTLEVAQTAFEWGRKLGAASPETIKPSVRPAS